MDEGAFLSDAVVRLGLAGGIAGFSRLAGGVSSDIWRVDLPGGRSICIKRALPKLQVAMDWLVPVERNAFEVAWIETAGRIEPDAVPFVLGHDRSAGMFAMRYLDPAEYRLWKQELREGRADPGVAADVGRRIASIHAGTAGNPEIAARFPNDEIFRAIRPEPYLEATAARHPDLRDVLFGLSRRTMDTKRCLIHGDVSPKNIVLGPRGPVFLDSECAWYGDPAFDIAFCLNHMLLKCLWVPISAKAFLSCFDALATAWLDGVVWEDRADAEYRAATLLPGLFLGRVDGKSPVEYLTADVDRDRVRRVARALLANPVTELAAVRAVWAKELGV